MSVMGTQTKLSKKLMKEKSLNNTYWYCRNCEQSFPYHNISDNELQCVLSDMDITLDKYELFDKCTKLNYESFRYSDFKNSDFEDNIDPDNNFYNRIKNKHNYYTEAQFLKHFKENENLNIIHFNARSLKANFVRIENYLCELKCMFDIITISETWLDKVCNLLNFHMEGYEMFHVNRINKRGGGVAIFVKKF